MSTIKSWFYDNFVAQRYDKTLAEVTDEFRLACIDSVGIQEGDTVLDLGCGTGLNQPHLANRVGPTGRIIGVDASPNMLSQANQRAIDNAYSDRLHLIHGDARQLTQILSGQPPVDAVIATLIFSVVPEWRGVFAQSFQVLKAGGRYGVMDNYWPNPSLRLWFLSWTFAADAKRPGFEPLQSVADDFVLEYLPPDAEVQFYVAHGTKPS